MAGSNEWYRELQSKLQNDNLRINTLTEIKNHLTTVSSDEASQTAHLLQLPLVFDCLNDSNSEQIELACDVLTLCMTNLSVGESTSRYADSLERALQHPSSNVKLMALKEIHRYTTNPEPLEQLCRQSSLIQALIQCISDENLTVANQAGNILTEVGKLDLGIAQLLQPISIQNINNVIDSKEMVRFRMYEVLIDIACTSNDHLRVIQNIGWLDKILLEMRGADVLLHLNTLELLTTLTSTIHGRTFVESSNLSSELALKLSAVKDDPFATILLPGLIKYFGNLAFWQPEEIFRRYPMFVDEIFNFDNLNTLATLGVTLDTLAHIASTNEGKFVLNSQGDRMLQLLRYIGQLISNVPEDYRLRALEFVSDLLKVRIEDQNEQVVSLTKVWFYSMVDNPMSFVMKYAQNAFPDIRIAGFKIIETIANQQWGQQLIIDTPGLFEFLLDRSVEHCKETKDVKYSIVKSLKNSIILDGSNLERVTKFVNQGPYYIDRQTEVATEGMPT